MLPKAIIIETVWTWLIVLQDLAWTGWKTSGLGSTLGPRGYDGFVKLKSYHIKDASA
jgi:acyl-CoA reductase-like NAD-dependent aldehyde dehydrogenase